MPHNPQDDWTRPVPRSPRRGGEESERTRPVPRAGADDGSDWRWRDEEPGRTRAIPRRGYAGDDGYEAYDSYAPDDAYGGNVYADDGHDASARGYYDENGDWVPRPRSRGRDDDTRGYRPREPRQAPAGGPPTRAPRPRTATAARPPRRRARYGFRRFLALLTLLLTVYVVAMAVVVSMIWGSIGRVDASPDVADRPGGSSGSAYLLVGRDGRGSEVGADGGGSRADTVMLLHVPTLGEPTLVSLPRDSFVPIRDYGQNKLNASHALGGPALLVDTVEQTTGIPVDGYMEIGFDGFEGVVEEVGGVHMCLDAPIQDERAHIDLDAGCQDLTGPEALGYVRMRYSDARGDLGRVERQRQFLAALVNRMASPATVLNPWRLHSVGTANGEALALGEDTSMLEAGRMALAMRTIAGGGGNSLTVPIANTDYPTAVGSTVLWDEQGAAELFAALREGRPVTVEP